MNDQVKEKILLIFPFLKALDEAIQSLNSDYEAKRYNNMTESACDQCSTERIYFVSKRSTN
jgi:hypothetical protein